MATHKRGRPTIYTTDSAKKRRIKQKASIRNASAIYLLDQLLPWKALRDTIASRTGKPVQHSEVAKHLLEIHRSSCSACSPCENHPTDDITREYDTVLEEFHQLPMSPILSQPSILRNDHGYSKLDNDFSMSTAVTSTPRQTPVARSLFGQFSPGSHEVTDVPENIHIAEEEQTDFITALNVSGMETLYDCEESVMTQHCDLSIAENIEVQTSTAIDTLPADTSQVLGEWEVDRDRSNTTRLLPETYIDNITSHIDMKEDLESAKEERFLVSHSALSKLLGKTCREPACDEPIQVTEKISGCVVTFKWCCVSGHEGNWSASPSVDKTYVTNLLAASSVLLSGNNFQKVNLLFKSMNVPFICDRTFSNVSRRFTNTVIEWFWHSTQDMIIHSLHNQSVSVSADGRCDSPGHSAQYCLYTFADNDSGYIVHTELVDKRETALKSSNMEKLGCERGLAYLKDKISFKDFTTDAHSQIKAMLKSEDWLQIINCHQMDIWHRVMHLSKKLTEVSKLRGNASLLEWIRPVKNHFWHCAESCGGDVEELKKNWLSLLRHVAGDHEWPGGQCSHGPIDDGDRRPLDRDSGAMEALRSVVMDRNFLRDLPYYVKFRHTFMLESFQNLCLVYAPKRVSFGYDGMKARSHMAAIDHNHHLHRNPAKDVFGCVTHSRKWCKRTGQWVAVQQKEKKDYGYLPVLNALVLHLRKTDKQPLSTKSTVTSNHPCNIAPNLASVPAPNTQELVQKQISRFGQK